MRSTAQPSITPHRERNTDGHKQQRPDDRERPNANIIMIGISSPRKTSAGSPAKRIRLRWATVQPSEKAQRMWAIGPCGITRAVRFIYVPSKAELIEEVMLDVAGGEPPELDMATEG